MLFSCGLRNWPKSASLAATSKSWLHLRSPSCPLGLKRRLALKNWRPGVRAATRLARIVAVPANQRECSEGGQAIPRSADSVLLRRSAVLDNAAAASRTRRRREGNSRSAQAVSRRGCQRARRAQDGTAV